MKTEDISTMHTALKIASHDSLAYLVSIYAIFGQFFTWLHDAQSDATTVSVWVGLALACVLLIKNTVETFRSIFKAKGD